jgi:hypothetical protein
MLNPLKLLASAFLIVGVAGCGGDENTPSGGAAGGSEGGAAAGSGSSPGGASSASGSASGGLSASGGSASNEAGMTSGGGTAGGSATGGHCSPGTPQPAINFIGGTIDKCNSVSGVSGGDELHILDIALTTPVGPGQTFAFSVDMKAPEGDYEMYGTDRECGDVGEPLSRVHVTGNGIICHEVKPTTETYSHLIWVWHTAGEMKNTTLCESGTCPAR